MKKMHGTEMNIMDKIEGERKKGKAMEGEIENLVRYRQ